MRAEKVRNRIRCAAAGLMAVVLCAQAGLYARAAGVEFTNVRVACGYNDFLKLDDDGNITGYYAEYLERIAQINNWHCEYVETGWNDAVTLLEAGEIDVICPANYSEERDLTMDFTNTPIGYTAAGIFARADSGYCFDDFAAFDGARIAVASRSLNSKELAAYANTHGFSYQPVYLNSNSEMVAALQTGRADMAVFSAANACPDGVLVSTMSPEPVYFAVQEGNALLLEQLDDAMQTLIKIDPSLVADVLHVTMAGDNSTVAALTAAEKAFRDSETPVVVGFYEKTEPLAYVKDDGTYDGVYIRLMNYLRDISGLNIQLKLISRDRTWRELINTGEIDFYIGASEVVIAKDSTLLNTDSVLDYSNILVTRNDCAFSKLERPVIALTVGRSYWENYLGNFLERPCDVAYYRTARDCMSAVARGEANATLLNNLEFNYHSKNDRFSALISWNQYRFPSYVGLATTNQVDEVMFTTVEKAIRLMDENYVNMVADECLSMPYHSYTPADKVYNARVPLTVVGAVLLALGGILAAAFIFRRRQSQIKELLKAREHRQLQLLAAISYDFSAIYYIDLDANTSEPVNQRAGLKEELGVTTVPVRKYDEALRFFTDSYVLPEYHESILSCLDKDTVMARFRHSPVFSVRYQIKPDVREQSYFEMRFVRVDKNTQGHDMMVMGIRCIDDIIREENKQRQLLQDALDGANRANTAKSEFFSRMSHDIRTPMNAIVGMTAIASAHVNEPDRVRDALGKINGASRHLLSLINDVLDMSKIETGKLSLTEEAINLPEFMGGLLNVIQPQIKQHKHHLQVNIRDVKHEDVLGDSLRIQQVFMNLMGNAVKYTPDGGEISLRVREIPLNTPNAGCFEFTVADNGIGMSQEYLEHIFEPFSRADDKVTNKIQGTGLGMAITQTIVQMMNGTIKVESELGKGSTFTVTLFLKLQETAAVDISDLAGLPVLVVDDDPDTCESVCLMLEELGMRGVGYHSGPEAMEAVARALDENAPFYAAILDWKMPGMNGVELAGKLKEMTGGVMPVVILSACDWSEIEDAARAAGVDRFVSKPVFRSGLVRLFSTLSGGMTETAKGASELDGLRQTDYTGRRVLLVEDNELNREIAREILEMTGLTVEEAEDGSVAVDMFSASESGYYDLILMDIQMPVMDGFEATRAIRGLSRADTLSVPIVAMTANAFVEDIQRCKSAGMNDHLAKPIDFDKLGKILREYL